MHRADRLSSRASIRRESVRYRAIPRQIIDRLSAPSGTKRECLARIQQNLDSLSSGCSLAADTDVLSERLEVMDRAIDDVDVAQKERKHIDSSFRCWFSKLTGQSSRHQQIRAQIDAQRAMIRRLRSSIQQRKNELIVLRDSGETLHDFLEGAPRLGLHDRRDYPHPIIVSESGAFEMLDVLTTSEQQQLNKKSGTLGAGAFGKVCYARNLASGEIVACKAQLLADGEGISNFIFENERLDQMGDGKGSVISMVGTQRMGYSFMTLSSGGDGLGILNDLIATDLAKLSSIDETDVETRLQLIKAKQLLPQVRNSFVFQAMQRLIDCHRKGVAHLDIKPDNYILGKDGGLRLIDFGLSTLEEVSHQKGGTPGFVAPEVISVDPSTTYDPKKADSFSLGVTLYIAYFPTLAITYLEERADAESLKDALKTLCEKPTLSDEQRSQVQLIQQLTDPNPAVRLAVADLPDHPLYQQLLASAEADQAAMALFIK